MGATLRACPPELSQRPIGRCSARCSSGAMATRAGSPRSAPRWRRAGGSTRSTPAPEARRCSLRWAPRGARARFVHRDRTNPRHASALPQGEHLPATPTPVSGGFRRGCGNGSGGFRLRWQRPGVEGGRIGALPLRSGRRGGRARGPRRHRSVETRRASPYRRRNPSRRPRRRQIDDETPPAAPDIARSPKNPLPAVGSAPRSVPLWTEGRRRRHPCEVATARTAAWSSAPTSSSTSTARSTMACTATG